MAFGLAVSLARAMHPLNRVRGGRSSPMVKPLAQTQAVVKARKRSRKEPEAAAPAAEPAPLASNESVVTKTTTTTTTVSEEPEAWDGAGADAAPTDGSGATIELEGIGGTSKIKRITWEGEPASESTSVERHVVDREWRPRHPATMGQIHWEIDHFGRSKIPGYRASSPVDKIRSSEVRHRELIKLATRHTGAHKCSECGRYHGPDHRGHDGKFYETRGGYVSRATHDSGRTVYHVKDRGVKEPRRFTPKLVDDVIRKEYRGDTDDVVVETTRTVTRNDGLGHSTTTTTRTVKRADGRPTHSEVTVDAPREGPVPDEIEGRPVCQAETKAGKPCQNKSRYGSKYCSSHKGYHPKN